MNYSSFYKSWYLIEVYHHYIYIEIIVKTNMDTRKKKVPFWVLIFYSNFRILEPEIHDLMPPLLQGTIVSTVASSILFWFMISWTDLFNVSD